MWWNSPLQLSEVCVAERRVVGGLEEDIGAVYAEHGLELVSVIALVK